MQLKKYNFPLKQNPMHHYIQIVQAIPEPLIHIKQLFTFSNVSQKKKKKKVSSITITAYDSYKFHPSTLFQ